MKTPSLPEAVFWLGEEKGRTDRLAGVERSAVAPGLGLMALALGDWLRADEPTSNCVSEGPGPSLKLKEHTREWCTRPGGQQKVEHWDTSQVLASKCQAFRSWHEQGQQ